jgi:hypothetical protein
MLAGMNRLVLALLGLATLACTPTPEPTNSPEPELDPRVARLCGTWRAEGPQGSIVEERWRASDEGLVGEGVTTDAEGETVSRESLLILLAPERSTYRALPQGAAGPTDFEQSADQRGEATDQWIWSWSNPAHDFPQAIRYEFTGADRMAAIVSGSDGEGGTQEFGWAFERIEACSGTSGAGH